MRRPTVTIPRFFLVLALFSCKSDSTGPSSIQRASLSLAPGFDRAVLAQVGVDRVVVRFTRTDGSKALETVVAFPAGSDTLNVAVSVPLIGASEAFDLTLLLIDDPAADTVFRSGPTSVILKADVAQSTVSVPPFLYVGPGANATGVRLVARPTVVGFGQTATFTAEAFDATGAVVPNAPILWSSSDPSKASVPNGAVGTVVGGTTRGSATVTASLLQTVLDTPPPSVGSTLVVQPVASALLAPSGSGQTGSVGAVLAQPLRVRVNAADNLGVQGVPVTFAVTSGGGSLSASQVVTDVNGDASLVWTLGGTVGAQTVSASVTGVAGATQTFSATGVAGPATKLAFTTQPSAVNAGVAISPVVVVEAQDSFGNTATSFTSAITMTFGASPAGATLGGTATVTAVNGVARFGDLTVSAVGPNVTLAAASSGLPGVTSTPFTVSAGAAATLAFTTQPSNGTAGSAITPAIVVTARDVNGNTATSFVGAVTLVLGANPGGGALSGTTTVNAVGGVATFSGVTLAKAASGYTLIGGATGLTSATSSAFSITPAPASALIFTTQPSAVNAGVAIAPVVVVEAQDSFGNAVTSFTGAVTIALGSSPAGATLGGTATVSAVNGVARFADLSVSTVGTGVTLVGTSSGLTGVTSASFTVGAGAPVALAFTTQPSNGTAGSAIAPAIVIAARDANGNTATSFVGAVTLALGTNPGSGTLAGTTTVTAVGGVATFSGITLATAAAGYTLTASATGLTSATSSAFTIAPASASTLAFTTQPSNATAGSTIAPAIVVTARDASGNTATAFVGAVTLALGTNPGSGTLTGTTTVTAVGGVATFSGVTLATAAAGYTLTATATGLTTATSSTFTIVPASGSTLVFTTQPSNGTAGSAIAPSIVVTARDASGNTVTSFVDAVTLALGANPGGGTLSGTTTVTAVGGVATFSGVTLATAAAGYTLTANALGLTSATSSAFTIAPAAASTLAFTTQPSNATAGSAIAPAIVVTARDANGNTATSFVGAVALALGANPGGGTLTGTTTVTAVGGVATFSGVTLANVGAGYTLIGSASGLTSATSSAFTIAPASASTLAFTTQPSDATAGSAIAPAIVVTARDVNGNTATSFVGAVTLAFGANPGGGTLTGTTTVTAAGGVATFSGITVANAAAGYTLTASATGLTSATSSAFTIAPASASSLVFTTQPSNGTAGSAIAPSIVVTARDASGNTVTSFVGAVTLTLGANPGGGTLSGTTTVTAVGGVATFSGVTLATAAAGYTLIGSASGLTSATSSTFTIVPASGSTLVFTTQPSNSIAGSAIAPSIVVTARDASGNTATSFAGAVTLAFGVNPGGGTLTGTTTVTAVGGVATFSGITLTKAATGYTLTATATGVTTATSSAFSIAPAGASVLAFTTQPSPSGAGAVITPAVGVTASDAFGNLVTAFTGNVVITIGSNPGGASLVGTTTVAAVGGVASFSNLSLTARGVGYTLVAAATGVTSATSTAFDIAATTLAWTNPSGGQWSNPSNWSLGRVPQGADSVVIAQPGTYTVTLDTTFSGAVITVGGSAGVQTLALASRTLTLSGVMTVKASGAFTATSSTIAGAGALVNQGVLNLKATNITTAGGLDNQGTVIANAGVSVSGPLTTAAGSMLRLLADGTTGFSTFTSANSFTNYGAIELTTVTSGYSPTLAVAGSNTLTNAPGGTITTLVGAGGPRTIDAQLVNQGTLALAQPLTLAHASAAHTNSGTIDASAADFTLNQSGTAPSFTNTGTVTLGAGRTWTINGGTLNQGAGISGTGTLSLNGLTANFATNVTNATTGFVATNVTINGPGTLTNASGQTMSLKAVTFGATSGLDNQGTLIANAGVTVNGSFTTNAGSTLRLLADGTTGFSTFTSANSFTNNGLIELTTATSGYSPTLAVAGGNTLTNAPGGTITTLVGAGGPRTIDAQLANQGTITLAQPLTLAHASAAHTNSGTIDASATDFTLNQSGTAPSFTNTGTVTLGAGRTWTINGGTLNQGAGISGAGTLSLNGLTANFATNVTNATTGFVATNVTINGPGTLTNASGQTMSLKAVTFGATSGLDNQGTLIANAGVTVNGAFTTNAGSTLRLLADGTTGFSTFTSANSFTNNGLIELTTATSGYSPTLAVAGSNTLTNAPGGTITTLVGAGGPRTIDAQLINQGTLTLAQPLTLAHASAAHANSGTIDVSAADFTLNQSGTSPSFTNTGTVAIGAGRSWTISGGALNQNAGTIGGAGTLSLNGLTANFATNVTNATTGFVATNVTFNGPGTLTNASGQTMSLKAVTVGATSGLNNQGTLIANASVTMNGSFTTNAGSTLRLFADGTTGFSTFTSANSFTNNGLIELTTATSGYSPTLAVAGSNTLTNAPGGTITTLVGAGGPRTIDAQLINQGTLTLAQPLTLAHASAAHANSGTIDVSAADFTLNQSGTSPSFTNSGTVTIGAGRSWTISGGALNQNAGTIGGTGTLALSNLTANFATNVTNATTAFVATNVTFNGPGTLTNASGQTMSLKAVTIGATSGLDNQGTLIANAAVTVNGSFTTNAGSTLRLLADGTTGFSTFTAANGLTNRGLIELTTATSGYSPTLVVGAGNQLTNAPGGTIATLVGAGGPRTIDAELRNQGTITLAQPLTLAHAGASHTNSSIIDGSGGSLTVNQSGTAPSFSNSGTINVGTGQLLTINGGSFTQAGTLNGSGGIALANATTTFSSPVTVSSLDVFGGSVGFASNQSTGALATSLVSTVVNGPGSMTNSAGQTLSIRAVTFNTNLINQGTLITDGASGVAAGSFSTASGSTLRLQATGSTGNSTFTVPSFTNLGAIELTTTVSSYTTALNVSSSGTLTNAPSGTITSLVGTGGSRTISANLVNQGVLTLNQPLDLNLASAAHSNSGTIDASNGNLTVNQSGSTFNNSGTIIVGAGHVMSLNGGSFAQNGALNGTGGLSLAGVTASFANSFALSNLAASGGSLTFTTGQSNAAVAMNLSSTSVNGPVGTVFTNAAGRTLNIRAVAFNIDVVNQGSLITDGASSVNGSNTFTAAAGSLLHLEATGSTGNSTLTLPPFTNAGAIELTTSTSSYTTNLTVNGALTNTGTITSLVGTGGTRTLSAQLVNQPGATVTVNQPLVINRANSAHSNAGTIDATNADLIVNQSGSPATFDNPGTLTVGAGHTFSISGGSFTFGNVAGAGTLSGGGTLSLNGTTATFNKPFTLPALNVTGGALSFANAQSTAGVAMNLVSTTVSSSSGLQNSVGATLNARAVTFNTILTNQGLLIVDGASAVSGPNAFFSNAAGSTLLIQATGSTGNSTFSVPSFTNAGAINMTTQTSSYTDVLTVGGGTGTLTNNSGATIEIFPGTGGTRTISGNLDNSGTITVHPGPSSAGTLQVSGTFNHRGVGVLNLEIASTAYSRMSVTGASFLFQGILNYALVNFTPPTGTTFDILTAGSVGGSFSVNSHPSGWASPAYLPVGAPATLVRLTAP